ncbi:MAG: diacylglycerol/lipid kinase family protein [Acidimicrobiales bacterium]
MAARRSEPAGEPGSQAVREQLAVPPLGSRIAAASALTVSAVTLAILVVFTARDLAYVLGSVAAGSLGISALWIAATNSRFRPWAAAAAVVLTAAAVASLVMVGRGALAVVTVIFGIAVASALGTLALRWEVRQAIAERWHEVPATRHGVVLMNQVSGNGKIAKLHLVEEARRRGIEPLLLERGGNLRALAEAAVARGADALGIAGGDGSQAVVAAVAASHGLPFVCVPAGTRNHLACDLGIDRRHPARALDAFGAARETTIDLGEVNGDVFVNNVSLGLYASIVASQKYREAKRRTVAEMLPDLLGPRAKPFDLVVDGPDGTITNAQVVQISNNPYVLSSVNGFGSRSRLDGGVLGVATLTVNGPSDVNRLVALEAAGHPERYQGWRDWTTTNLEVRGPSMLAAAVDGEARTSTAPLHFAVRPGALRVRVSLDQPGASPAFLHAPVAVSTLLGLARVVRGRPSGIVGKAGNA